jgi:hypothetical protein
VTSAIGRGAAWLGGEAWNGLQWLGGQAWKGLKGFGRFLYEPLRRTKEYLEGVTILTWLRAGDPKQTAFDIPMGTIAAEDAAFHYGIVVAGGDVDQRGCPPGFLCIVRLQGPVITGSNSTAQSVGRVLLFENNLDPRLAAHEAQHGKDVQEMGFIRFAYSYILSSMEAEALGGDWHYDNYYERRARETEVLPWVDGQPQYRDPIGPSSLTPWHDGW